MHLKPILGGLKSYLPFLTDYTGTGGTNSVRYCYSVWLRHSALLHAHGLPTVHRLMVELGPGDSIGVGIAALLTTVESYVALDVVAHNKSEHNRVMVGELQQLLAARAPVPDERELPFLHPRLPDYAFPTAALPDACLDASLAPARVAALREAVMGTGPDASRVRYICPWSDPEILPAGTADYVMSQGALQDVEPRDLPDMYRCMHRWLRPGGVMTHQIDLSSPVSREHWNDHWTYPDWAWRLVRGRRPYHINRQPLSRHVELLKQAGLDLVGMVPVTDPHSAPRSALAAPFRGLPDQDLQTRAVFLIARRPS